MVKTPEPETPYEMELVEARDITASIRLTLGANEVCCVRCHKPLWTLDKYRVRTFQSSAMKGPAFYNYCMDCPCP